MITKKKKRYQFSLYTELEIQPAKCYLTRDKGLQEIWRLARVKSYFV